MAEFGNEFWESRDPILRSIAATPAPKAPGPLQLSWDSSSALPTDGNVTQRTDQRRISPSAAGRNGFWLDGDVLLCACPDCGCPMTVRLWLMTADCWNCQLTIALTEEQEREVQRLLAEREDPQRRPLAANAAPNSDANAAPTDSAAAPNQTAGEHATGPRRRRKRRRRAAPAPAAHSWTDLPAWFVSLLLHCIALTLLALWHFNRDDLGPEILLSSEINDVRMPGGEVDLAESEGAWDLPIPKDLDMQDRQTREAVLRANQEARQLRVDPEDESRMRPLTQVKQELSRSGRTSAALSARDPRLRVDLVQREGGTTLTEAAVARGLRWLASQQRNDGSWELDGNLRSRAAGTSLALLPFLGAGQTHLAGRYKHTVAHGLRWLIENQKSDGDLRSNPNQNSGMYAHGQGAIVLCEAYLMTGDEGLRAAAQKAIDFIVEAQHAAGGWRYQPGQAGDTSVAGWQIMALQSGIAAGLTAPKHVMELASQYLDSVEYGPDLRGWKRRWRSPADDSGLTELARLMRGGETKWSDYRSLSNAMSDYQEKIERSSKLRQMREELRELLAERGRYSYQPKHTVTPAMTAEALLCRVYMGWSMEEPGFLEGVDYVEQHPPSNDDRNIYYWYYGTQLMHHVGGERWDRWNKSLRGILVETQQRAGRDAGSWSDLGGFSDQGGRIYVTSLAVCTLEVYYRHLPIFRQIDLQ